MFRGKKGSQNTWDIVFPIFQLLLTVAIFILLLKFVVDTSTGLALEKDYYARDLALLLDTVEAASGEVTYIYPSKIQDYDVGVEHKQNFIVIYDVESEQTIIN